MWALGYCSRSARSVGVAITASPTQLGCTTRIFEGSPIAAQYSQTPVGRTLGALFGASLPHIYDAFAVPCARRLTLAYGGVPSIDADGSQLDPAALPQVELAPPVAHACP